MFINMLYTMDCEIKEFIHNNGNHENSKMAVNFTKCLREDLKLQFPDFQGDRDLNCYGNYLNLMKSNKMC